MGKTIVVVGAGGNLGPVWVEALLREGASVLATGLAILDDAGISELASSYPNFLTAINLDISTPEGVQSWDIPGGIDGVVLNAGIDSVPGTGKQALTDYSFSDWRQLFDVNVIGCVALLNRLIPYLGNPSSVVTLGSLYALVSPKPALYSHFNDGDGSIKHPAYGASKAALLAMTRQYGTHLAPQGIRCNMLTLGGVEAGQDDSFVTKFEAHVPQGRMLEKNDLVGALVFLLSGESSSMTGHNLVLDGGYTTW